MKTIWQYTFNDKLSVAPENQPVLLTESPLNSNNHREKMAEVMFEDFHVPALYIANQATLSLYAAGRTTGIVLDSGHTATHVTPIHEGSPLTNGIARYDFGGSDLTRFFLNIAMESGIIFFTNPGLKLVETIKEELCYVALNSEEEARQDATRMYELPDGEVITINAIRYPLPSSFFPLSSNGRY
jgi:actin